MPEQFTNEQNPYSTKQQSKSTDGRAKRATAALFAQDVREFARTKRLTPREREALLAYVKSVENHSSLRNDLANDRKNDLAGKAWARRFGSRVLRFFDPKIKRAPEQAFADAANYTDDEKSEMRDFADSLINSHPIMMKMFYDQKNREEFTNLRHIMTEFPHRSGAPLPTARQNYAQVQVPDQRRTMPVPSWSMPAPPAPVARRADHVQGAQAARYQSGQPSPDLSRPGTPVTIADWGQESIRSAANVDSGRAATNIQPEPRTAGYDDSRSSSPSRPRRPQASGQSFTQ
ncbi:hypothetical protein [Actinoplanes sp. NPDC048796]|uniref:hypothetical protein n=1 Tax=Actinoplanes sp. NPDC048796 TaxID=3155640 RepID=UPI0034000067